jgi:hypothetical protein
MPNAECRMPNAECRTPNAEFGGVRSQSGAKTAPEEQSEARTNFSGEEFPDMSFEETLDITKLVSVSSIDKLTWQNFG